MSRHDDQRLTDILAAVEAIAAHLGRGWIFTTTRPRFTLIEENAPRTD